MIGRLECAEGFLKAASKEQLDVFKKLFDLVTWCNSGRLRVRILVTRRVTVWLWTRFVRLSELREFLFLLNLASQ